MKSFIDWLQSRTKHKGKKNGEQYCYQGSGKSGYDNHQGQANRLDQEIPEPIVYRFTEPR